MAWSCSGRTNVELIENMARNGLITSTRVAEAMKKVDRANYVLARDARDAYQDSPQAINHGATISAPHMHAHAAENLLPFLNPSSNVLDIGSGSGYTVAIFHHLISSSNSSGSGKVIGIDHIPSLVEWSLSNLRSDGLGRQIDNGLVQVIASDGRQGHEACAPYSVIHVGAAAPTIPQPLIDQLAKPGRMFIPVGTAMQEVVQVDKDENGNVTQKSLFGVRYVPLTSRDQQDL